MEGRGIGVVQRGVWEVSVGGSSLRAVGWVQAAGSWQLQSPWEVPAAHVTDILYGGSVAGASGQEQSVVGLHLPYFVRWAGGSDVDGLEAGQVLVCGGEG
jgi:hypothetical protein